MTGGRSTGGNQSHEGMPLTDLPSHGQDDGLSYSSAPQMSFFTSSEDTGSLTDDFSPPPPPLDPGWSAAPSLSWSNDDSSSIDEGGAWSASPSLSSGADLLPLGSISEESLRNFSSSPQAHTAAPSGQKTSSQSAPRPRPTQSTRPQQQGTSAGQSNAQSPSPTFASTNPYYTETGQPRPRPGSTQKKKKSHVGTIIMIVIALLIPFGRFLSDSGDNNSSENVLEREKSAEIARQFERTREPATPTLPDLNQSDLDIKDIFKEYPVREATDEEPYPPRIRTLNSSAPDGLGAEIYNPAAAKDWQIIFQQDSADTQRTYFFQSIGVDFKNIPQSAQSDLPALESAEGMTIMSLLVHEYSSNSPIPQATLELNSSDLRSWSQLTAHTRPTDKGYTEIVYVFLVPTEDINEINTVTVGIAQENGEITQPVYWSVSLEDQ